MTHAEILRHVDHTNLKPTATTEDIKATCAVAETYNVAAICIAPTYVKFAKNYAPNLKICTVIGFPLGSHVLAVELAEAQSAIDHGADELDVVVDLGAIKNGNFTEVKHKLQCLRDICPDKILKVIVETCYLTETEKIKLCQIVTEVKADYIKTSTGFGTGGATVDDVELFRANIGPEVKIKAAGGINDFAFAEALITAGADRLGSSRLAYEAGPCAFYEHGFHEGRPLD